MNTAELNAILRDEITAMLEENRNNEGALHSNVKTAIRLWSWSLA